MMRCYPEGMPGPREQQKSPEEDSLRKREERLQDVRDRLKTVNKRIVASRNPMKLYDQRRELVKEEAQLVYQQLTPEKKQARLELIWDTLSELNACYAEGALIATEQKRDQLSNEFARLMDQVPAQDWHAYSKKRRQQEPWGENRVEQGEFDQEECAREIISDGIAKLAEVLEQMRAHGGLPRVIIYPDTSARPLRYAVEPLLKQVYEQAGLPRPQEEFVQPFTQTVLPEHRKAKLKEWEHEKKVLQKERDACIQKRQSVLRMLRQTKQRIDRDPLSLQAHELDEQIREKGRQIFERDQRVELFAKEADRKVLEERLSEIATRVDSGPWLVIDEVIGSLGRTFTSLATASQRVIPDIDVSFFAFTGIPDSLRYFDEPLDPRKISIGVGFEHSSDVLPEDREQCGVLLTEEDSPRFNEVAELHTNGFPFRSDKQAFTGVVKTAHSLDPLVTLSPKRDPKRVREIREQYRRWGEEALEKMQQDHVQSIAA